MLPHTKTLPRDGQSRMEALVEGMQNLLRRNLCAESRLIANAHKGETSLMIDNTLRFNQFDEIAIMGDNAAFGEGVPTAGMEFNRIREIVGTNGVILEEPLTAEYYVGNTGRIQKSLHNTILSPGDIYYGDREVLTFDSVAITVEPEGRKGEWIALEGLLSTEYRMGIQIYVKADDENPHGLSSRIRDAYADAIYSLLIGNIHLDLVVEEVALARDVYAGQSSVFILASEASRWLPSDICFNYEVQDNFSLDEDLGIVHDESYISSSSSSGWLGYGWGSTSSSSITSASSSSDSSESSISGFISSNTSSSSSSSRDEYEVFLTRPLANNFRVRDKAVLRRKYRYFYDSRPDGVEYGKQQKGGPILKGAKISWWGKETQAIGVPQLGKGGRVY